MTDIRTFARLAQRSNVIIDAADIKLINFELYQSMITSVQSRGRLGRLGDMRDDSAEILLQPFLQEALVSSSGMDRDVHSLMMSLQHFLCRPRLLPTSMVP